MKILFMGTPDFAQVSLKRLLDSEWEICGVVTQPDKPKGRGHKLQPPPVKELAILHNIPIFQPETLKDNAFEEQLRVLNPNMIVVVAYGKILPKYILDYPKLSCINVHASLLPKYRGAAPIHWSIINGEIQTGITTMYMAEGLDTGDMILKSEVEIGENTTVGELHDELATLGADVLVETIERILDGSAPREAQNETLSTYASMIDRNTGKIDWTKSARKIVNLIRGTNPFPGAFTWYNGEKLKIWQARLGKSLNNCAAGEIIYISDGKLEVAAGDGNSVLIEKIQIQGGKSMSVASFLNGNKPEVGVVLGNG